MFAKYRQISLIVRIVIGLIVGTLLGVCVPSLTWIGLFGDLFIGALKGIAPLLMFFLIMTAISKYEAGDETHFGSVIVLYLSATFLSAVLAVVASFIFRVKLVFLKAVHVAQSAPKDLDTDDWVCASVSVSSHA